MRSLSAAGLALLVCVCASAADMGPTSQTLEALRGEAVTNPDRFFDGLDARVTEPTPIFYAPLPSEPALMPGDTSFDSRRIAPGLTLHEPLPAGARTSSSSSGSMSTGLMFALGAALVATAVLLLLFL